MDRIITDGRMMRWLPELHDLMDVHQIYKAGYNAPDNLAMTGQRLNIQKGHGVRRYLRYQTKQAPLSSCLARYIDESYCVSIITHMSAAGQRMACNLEAAAVNFRRTHPHMYDALMVLASDVERHAITIARE